MFASRKRARDDEEEDYEECARVIKVYIYRHAFGAVMLRHSIAMQIALSHISNHQTQQRLLTNIAKQATTALYSNHHSSGFIRRRDLPTIPIFKPITSTASFPAPRQLFVQHI